MRPTTAFDDNVFDINALLHPGTVFDHPREVLAHPSLSVSEKRAILASWASDASASRPRCEHLRAPARLPSTKSPMPVNSTMNSLPTGASRTGCVQRQGRSQPREKQLRWTRSNCLDTL